MRTPDHNQNLIIENNNFTENTSSIPQCNFCGMPMCDNCFSQLQTFHSQDDKQCSVEKDSSVLYFHLEECKVLQEEEIEVLRSIYEGDSAFSIQSDTKFQYKMGSQDSDR